MKSMVLRLLPAVLTLVAITAGYAGSPETTSTRPTQFRISDDDGDGTLPPMPAEDVRKLKQLIEDANNRIDFITEREEEWGWVQTSDILPIPNTENLDVSDSTGGTNGIFPKGTADYVANAGIEQAQAVVDVKQMFRSMTTANIGSGSTTASLTPPNTGITTALPASNAAPTAYALPTDNPSIANLTNTAPNANFALSDREKMVIGVNDELAARLYTLMGSPPPVNGRRLYLGVFQVSCQPGWRTREHYKAVVNVRLDYAYKNPLKLSENNTRDGSLKDYNITYPNGAPGVYAVLPLLDDQVQGLQGSETKAMQLYAQIAGLFAIAGHPVQAQQVGEYIHQVQSAQRTITPVPLVSSFSNENTFGFTFSPAYQALEDPREPDSKAENVLYPTSFPAVVMLLMDDKDLLDIKRTSDQIAVDYMPAMKKLKAGGKIEGEIKPFTPQYGLQISVTQNWMLTDRHPIWPRNRYSYDSRADELEALAVAERDTLRIQRILIDARKADKELYKSPKYDIYEGQPLLPYWAIHRELYMRVQDLESKSLGHTYASPMPSETFWYAAAQATAQAAAATLPPSAPTLTGVNPNHGWQTQDTILLLSGTSLFDTVMVSVAGVKAQILSKSDTALMVKVPPVPIQGNNTGPFTPVLYTLRGAATGTGSATTISFDLNGKPAPGGTIAPQLTSTGTTTVTGPVSLTGSTTLTGPLTLTGSTILTGVIDPTGTTTLTGPMTLTGSTTPTGPIFLTGSTSLTGTSTFSGTTTLTGSTTLAGPLTLTAATALTGTTTATGTTTLTGNITVTGSSTPTGSLTLKGPSTLTGITKSTK